MPRDVSAQFKENGDSKGSITVEPAAIPKGTGKAVLKAIDGNEATANMAYAFNDVSFIYPITPATPMGEAVDQWSNEGRVNLNGNVMEVRVLASYPPMRAVGGGRDTAAGSSSTCTHNHRERERERAQRVRFSPAPTNTILSCSHQHNYRERERESVHL